MVHQKYKNELAVPLEIVFLLPASDSFACNKIQVDFTLTDGTTQSIETVVKEIRKAKEVYEDAVAKGNVAVLGTLPPSNTQYTRSMMKIVLGNMPASCEANLRAYCSQKLEIEDLSYCLRIPMTYIPAYLGPVSNLPGLQ